MCDLVSFSINHVVHTLSIAQLIAMVPGVCSPVSLPPMCNVTASLLLRPSDECSSLAPVGTQRVLALIMFFSVWVFIVWETMPVPLFSLRRRQWRMHLLRLERPLAALVRDAMEAPMHALALMRADWRYGYGDRRHRVADGG